LNIWITGARGFIGRHLARQIGNMNHDVAGIGHGLWLENDRSLWNVSNWLNGDVSQSNLDVLLKTHGMPDAIFHLAGGSSVGPSFSMPLEDMHRSVNSLSELLEWVRLRTPTTSIVMTSSAAIYGAGHDGLIKESSIFTPYSPYGYHKRMSELLLESYARNFKLKVAVVRLFSVYGVGLQKQLLWDACSRLADNADTVEFGGTGNELRDWLHVEDAAGILWKSLEKTSEEYFVMNGGTGIATSVSDITNEICKDWGRGKKSVFTGVTRVGDPASLVADTEKLNKLNFKASHEWQKGISEYVAWFKAQQ
jgi:UDP-glucose 4-epimerase